MNTDGYAAMPRAILYDPALSSHAKLMYLALSSFIGAAQECWPSLPRLVEVTGLSQSTVQRALAELRVRGTVTWRREREPGSMKFSRTIYTLRQPVVTMTSG